MNCSVGGTDDAKRALYYKPNNAIVLFFHIRMENRPYSWRCKFEPPQLLGGEELRLLFCLALLELSRRQSKSIGGDLCGLCFGITNTQFLNLQVLGC